MIMIGNMDGMVETHNHNLFPISMQLDLLLRLYKYIIMCYIIYYIRAHGARSVYDQYPDP